MHIMLILFISTVCLLTNLSSLTATNTTSGEPTTSTGPDHLHKSTVISNSQSETRHAPGLIHGSVGPVNDGKPQFQNGTKYGRKTVFAKSNSSTISELKNNYSIENYIINIPLHKTLSSDARTQERKDIKTTSSPVSEYSSSASDKNDQIMTNTWNTTQAKQQYKSVRPVSKLRGNNTLEYESERMLDLPKAKTDPYVESKRFDGRYVQCKCDNTMCNFSNCNLSAVPTDLNLNVTELFLQNNNFVVLPSNIFLRYTFLEILDLSNNSISVVGHGAFKGLARLTSLDLSHNLIGRYTGISNRVFEPLQALKILRLYVNDFPCDNSPPIQDKMLAYLHNVEELYIDNYGNQEYGPGFKNMTSLRNLSFSCLCSIGHMSNTTFINLKQITFLDISACNIHGNDIDVGTFAHLQNLTILDIYDNKDIGMEYLPVILRELKNSSMQVLRMDNIVSDFSVNFINSSLTQYLPQNLTTLFARDNNIMSIDVGGFISLPDSLQFIDLSNNFMLMLAIYFPLGLLSDLEVLLVNTDLKQCLSNDRSIQDLPARSKYDIQKLKKHMNRQTEKNKIAGRDQHAGIKIPERLKRIQINVQRMHETFLFNIDSENSLEEIDLRCSVIPDFNFVDIFNFPNLRYLNLGRSFVEKFHNSELLNKPLLKVLILESNRLNDFLSSSDLPFKGLNLSHLDLSLNQINTLNREVFSGLDNLEYLRLDGNTISFFGANISNMEQLKVLNVSNTALTFLPTPVRSHIDHLSRVRPDQITVDMSGCPIQCECFNLDFLKWMVKSPAFDQQFTGYKCRYSDTSFKYILDGYQETIGQLTRECAENYPVFLVILAATLILLCAVVGTIVYRFRWKLRYLYYAAYLKVMDNKRRDKKHEFKHDVFVGYDSEDQRFVRKYLAPELENRGLKLLIHTRDFVAGTYIASNIVMAVAESRKTLVVLTRNLLDSAWCNYEIQVLAIAMCLLLTQKDIIAWKDEKVPTYKMATMEAVHTGRQVLVFLLKENIPNRELDVELLRYIKSNTYLPYPSPEDEGDEEIMKRFYDKLAHDLRS